MQWYFAKNGTQLGPVSLEELRAKLASGEVTAADMVWKEGFPDWRRAGEIQELMAAPVISPAVLREPPSEGTVPGSPYQAPMVSSAYPGMMIPNYLWQSIVVTILCCWPLGIPAIVYAAKVDGMKARGDIQGAMTASANAKMWCWVAVGSWAVLIVIYVIIAGVVGFGSVRTSP